MLADGVMVGVFFQVKQQKKNSNKWTCVVCNEKQSVRKVYAQGSMAKDVRKFVQSFNMSRKSIDEEENLTVMVADGEEVGGSCSGNGKKRRSDWSEYLDPEEEEEERGLFDISMYLFIHLLLIFGGLWIVRAFCFVLIFFFHLVFVLALGKRGKE